MAERNGIPLTGDPRVDAALERIAGKFRDIEDAWIVQAELEKRQGELLKKHSELISDHAGWQKRTDEAIQRYEEWMRHMEDKLAALTDILMRREGGPEAK